MNEQIQQIAERLAGLRDALEITPEEMAKVCNLTTEQYLLLESGTVDISVSVLHQILTGLWRRINHVDVWRRA